MGSKVNLERALKAGQRFSGHFVQGHVDIPVEIVNITADPPNSVIYEFRVPESNEIDYIKYIIPKGYACLDGTSLTVISVDKPNRTFTVMLVKYTQDHVVMPMKVKGDLVNLEVDQIGKYVENVVLSMMSADSASRSMFESMIRNVVENMK